MNAPAVGRDFTAFREALCAREDTYLREVVRRHQDGIQVKSANRALSKLALIFEKTLAISNRHGFQAMSVRDLGQATGISMGSLYSYIESKDRLLGMILTYGQVVVDHNLRVPEGVGPRGQLHHVLRTHVYVTEVLQPWFYFAYMESRHFDRRSRRQAIDGELRTEALITGLLREGAAQGVFRIGRPELTAALIKPLLQDWYLKRWKYRHRMIGVEDYADDMIAFVDAALTGAGVDATNTGEPA